MGHLVFVNHRRRRHQRFVNHLSASQLILDRLPPGSRVTLLIASIDSGPAPHMARERILRDWERKRGLITNIVFVINGEFTRSYFVDEILQPDQRIIDGLGCFCCGTRLSHLNGTIRQIETRAGGMGLTLFCPSDRPVHKSAKPADIRV